MTLPSRLSPKFIANLLGVSFQTLARWDKNGQLQAQRTPTGRRYYTQEQLEVYMLRHIDFFARRWASKKQVKNPPAEFLYCQQSAIFQSRLVRLETELLKSRSSDSVSLLTAAIGEIGNNSFDHNLGNWSDIPGIFFGFSLEQKQVVLVDRGKGVLYTLKRVRPELASHKEALYMAFTEIITGRAPENRGNGLKFVRQIITTEPLKLWFQSGDTSVSLQQGQKDLIFHKEKKFIPGTLSIIQFT